MDRRGVDILRAHHELDKSQPKDSTEKTDSEQEVTNDLREFIRTYITSLSNIVRAFPDSNLDINALEAHTWDRLRYFYTYDSFKHVKIETKQEVEFINKAIELIEDWFYKGDWTACLVTPSNEQIQTMLSGSGNSFLKRVRRVKDTKKYPNLGRDTNRPLPNIYTDASSGRDLRQVYEDHAFKFFHGPAATINTLTKIATQPEVRVNRRKFDDYIRSTMAFAGEKFQQWGYGPKDPNVRTVMDSVHSLNGQPDILKRCRRTLFFIKTSLEGAEMIRRTGQGELTKENFEKTLAWIKAERKKLAERRGFEKGTDFIPFSFVDRHNPRQQDFIGPSLLHVNAKELPLALMGVDYLRAKHNKK